MSVAQARIAIQSVSYPLRATEIARRTKLPVEGVAKDSKAIGASKSSPLIVWRSQHQDGIPMQKIKHSWRYGSDFPVGEGRHQRPVDAGKPHGLRIAADRS